MSAIEVIATGARTPLGLTGETTAAAVRAGIAGFEEFPFALASGEPVVTCADAELDPKLEGRERLVPMIESAIGEAMRKLSRGNPYRGVCYLLFALPE